jgi:hypothetical protein
VACVSDATPSLGDAVPEQGGAYPNLAQEREFVDEGGVVWHRRGGLVADERLRRLLADGAVRVLHDYLGNVTEVPSDRRAAFCADAEAKMRASDYSHFYGAEFKNDDRDHLLVIHEDC